MGRRKPIIYGKFLLKSSQTKQFDLAGADHFRLDNRLIYRVKINDSLNCCALVDTGAMTSILSAKLCAKLGKLNDKNIVKVSGYDGHTTDSLGTKRIKLTLIRTNTTIKLNALVVKECNPPIILGVDDVKKLGFRMVDPKGTECLTCSAIPFECELDENLFDFMEVGDQNLELFNENKLFKHYENSDSTAPINNCNHCTTNCSNGAMNCNATCKRYNENSKDYDHSKLDITDVNEVEKPIIATNNCNHCCPNFSMHPCKIKAETENRIPSEKDTLKINQTEFSKIATNSCNNCNQIELSELKLENKLRNECTSKCNQISIGLEHCENNCTNNCKNDKHQSCNVETTIATNEFCNNCNAELIIHNRNCHYKGKDKNNINDTSNIRENCKKCTENNVNNNNENSELEFKDVCFSKQIIQLDDGVFGIRTWSQIPGVVSPLSCDFIFLDGIISAGENLLIGHSDLDAQELLNKPVARVRSFKIAYKVKPISNNEINSENKDMFAVLTINSNTEISTENATLNSQQSSTNNDNSVARTEELMHAAKSVLDGLSEAESDTVRGWFRDFPDTFALDHDSLGYNNLEPVKIETPNQTVPLYTRSYRIPYMYRKAVDEQVEDLLRRGLVRDSLSGWNSPCLAVPKRDSAGGMTGVRLVIDYRELNKISTQKMFPIPFVEDALNKLRGNQYYTSLDLMSGFHQLGLSACSIPKTAFTVNSRHLEFTVLPFGISQGPMVFQKIMDRIFRPSLDPALSIYIDDLILSSQNLSEADKDTRRILTKLKENNLKVKLSKCTFLKEELKFLGHVINQAGIKPDPAKIIAIQNIRRPHDKRTVRRFLGACAYYAKFIPKFAHHARPLQKLTGNVPFIWEDSHEESYQFLKSYLRSSDLLIYPNPNQPYYLTSDASTHGLGGVLSQLVDGIEKPIIFLSRALRPAETRYSAYELELLSIVYCLTKTRTYTLGQQITVRSDHRPLKWLMTNSKALTNSRLARWVITLLDYDLRIEYIAGKSNKVADMLSRDVEEIKQISNQSETEDILEKAKLPCSTLYQVGPVRAGLPIEYIIPNKDNYIKLQETDSELIHLHSSLLHDTIPDFPPTGKKLLLEELTTVEGILHIRGPKGKLRLYVPKELRHSVMFLAHRQKGKIHVAKNEMASYLSENYYWPNMNNDIKEFTSTCHLCLSTKSGKLPPTPIQPVDTGSAPWTKVHLDLLGPFRKSAKQHRFLLNIVCSFSKFCMLFPLKTKTAEEICQIINNLVIPLFGAPEKFISDRGVEWLSLGFHSVCKEWNIRHAASSSYHPQFNGKIERTHADIGRMLRTLLFETNLEWDLLIGEIITAMNNRVSSVTGYTPFSVFYSRSFNLPSSMLEPIENNIPIEIPSKKFVSLQAKANKLRWKEINERLDLIYNYDYYNQAKNLLVDDSPIGLHDFVYINVPRPGKTKLSLKFPGPYEILEQITPRSYKLKSLVDGHQIILHEERIIRHAPFVQADRFPTKSKNLQLEKVQKDHLQKYNQTPKTSKRLKAIAPKLYQLGEEIPPNFEMENNAQENPELDQDPLEEPPEFRIEENDYLMKKNKIKTKITKPAPTANTEEEEEDFQRIDRPRRNLRVKINYKRLHNVGK